MDLSFGARALKTGRCTHLAAVPSVSSRIRMIGRSFECCPSCAVVNIERLLKDGKPPATIAARITFATCGHPAPCWPCAAALKAHLTARWSWLFYVNRPWANRVQRVIHQLSRTVAR